MNTGRWTQHEIDSLNQSILNGKSRDLLEKAVKTRTYEQINSRIQKEQKILEKIKDGSSKDRRSLTTTEETILQNM